MQIAWSNWSNDLLKEKNDLQRTIAISSSLPSLAEPHDRYACSPEFAKGIEACPQLACSGLLLHKVMITSNNLMDDDKGKHLSTYKPFLSGKT